MLLTAESGQQETWEHPSSFPRKWCRDHSSNARRCGGSVDAAGLQRNRQVAAPAAVISRPISAARRPTCGVERLHCPIVIGPLLPLRLLLGSDLRQQLIGQNARTGATNVAITRVLSAALRGAQAASAASRLPPPYSASARSGAAAFVCGGRSGAHSRTHGSWPGRTSAAATVFSGGVCRRFPPPCRSGAWGTASSLRSSPRPAPY